MPSGWSKSTLDKVLEKIIDYRGQSVPKSENGIPLITARNVREGYLDFATQEYVDEAEYENWMTRGMPQKGDVLITTEAPLGMVAMYPCDNQKYAVGQRTVTLRPSQELDSKYLMYYLLGPGSKEIQDRATGSTAKGIKSSELKKVSVVYPTKTEQEKIAKIISTWDEGIWKLDKLISNKVKAKNEISHRLISGASNPKYSQSWKKYCLKDLCEIKHGHAFDGQFFTSEETEYLLLTPGNFHVDQSLYFGSNTKYFSGDILEDYVLKNGDLLVVMTDLTKEMNILGNSVILNSEKKVLHNQRIGKVVNISPNIHVCYLKHLLNSSIVKKHVKSTASGSTVRHTSPSRILEVEINLPSLKEQVEICNVIEASISEITTLQKIKKKILSQKQGLMQQLLTGKKRVRI